MTQLDLAMAAEVSTRHLSCLETGRARPSEDMVLLLAANLDVPLREQNAMLEAAGFEHLFDEPSLAEGLDPVLSFALERMLAKHEPYPMFVMNRRYDILRCNHGAARMLRHLNVDPAARPNAYRLLFDPALGRPFVADWPRAGRALLSRLHREALHRPEDGSLHELVEALLAYPDVPETWRQPDFSIPNLPTYALQLDMGGQALRFLTTVTAFNAPSNVTLEELRIESWFPLDPATDAVCAAADRDLRVPSANE